MASTVPSPRPTAVSSVGKWGLSDSRRAWNSSAWAVISSRLRRASFSSGRMCTGWNGRKRSCHARVRSRNASSGRDWSSFSSLLTAATVGWYDRMIRWFREPTIFFMIHFSMSR